MIKEQNKEKGKKIKRMSIRDYILIQIVGQGVFGDVWLAEKKEKQQKEVAIKIYKKSTEKCKRYEKSLSLAKELIHPNLIKVHSYFVDRINNGASSLAFISVLEYVDGFNIGIIPDIETKMMGYIPQLKSLFDYLKDVGVVHRDIKPENIMVTVKDEKIKLIDYDFMKKESNELYNTVGTPLFCAPEVYSGKPFTHKSDLWSLGATLYFALCKLHPFDAEDHHSLKMLLLSDLPADFSPISIPYVPLLSSLLNKDIDQRIFP